MNGVCQICFSRANHANYRCREQMFGWGGEFDYFCCAECGCLQIGRVPEDLSRFYPPIYYSFHLQPIPRHGLKSWLGGRRDYWAATGRGLLGFLVNKLVPARVDVSSLGGIPARKEMRILDVGCGSGELLSILHRAGVGQLEGIDPYLSAEVEVLPGLRVRKLALQEVSGEFDLIMLHHVFEHVEFGRELLAAARQRLSARGGILLRFPTPESAAWEQYRENWVQVDAPRHLFLHTRKSLGILAGQAGLAAERCWCDSSAFQFWASELYKRGVSLYDQDGRSRNPENYFTKAEMRAFAHRAKEVNASGRGDQLVVVLKALDPKPGPA
jgi:SAM-dependent methyltransferase